MSEEMTGFERSVQQAMQRVEVPPTLLRSVMAAVEAQSVRKPTWGERFQAWLTPQPRVWATGAMAALLALAALGGEQWHQHRERELANAQFEAATRITDQALEHTRRQLERAGVPLE
jgi:hypothetical protein